MLQFEQKYGIRSSFEFVPEQRYEISRPLVNAIRAAECEVCIHGLNHDDKLFSSEQEFRARAKKINQYANDLGASGFRSPVMYRNPLWFDAFAFSYDMSVPNVAHLDPQRGGCCTVFPFFIGDILELPLTTIQDYPIYNILRSNPLQIWTSQLETILAKHGLASFLIHPDYTMEQDRQTLYCELLDLIKTFGVQRNLWLALPGEVDRWWRQRNSMVLSQMDGKWVIRGDGSDRAAIAYARIERGTLSFVTEWTR
jgi:peptidoglycan/xylan/chitin deacetylase (PgdA/CDA1 family)